MAVAAVQMTVICMTMESASLMTIRNPHIIITMTMTGRAIVMVRMSVVVMMMTTTMVALLGLMEGKATAV